jgi:hypothetical protein
MCHGFYIWIFNFRVSHRVSSSFLFLFFALFSTKKSEEKLAVSHLLSCRDVELL